MPSSLRSQARLPPIFLWWWQIFYIHACQIRQQDGLSMLKLLCGRKQVYPLVGRDSCYWQYIVRLDDGWTCNIYWGYGYHVSWRERREMGLIRLHSVVADVIDSSLELLLICHQLRGCPQSHEERAGGSKLPKQYQVICPTSSCEIYWRCSPLYIVLPQ